MRLETRNINHIIGILSDYMPVEKFVREMFKTGDIMNTGVMETHSAGAST